MSKQLVFAVATCQQQAGQIFERLKLAGFSSYALSAIFPDDRDSLDPANTKSPRKQRTELSNSMRRTTWRTVRRYGFASVGAFTVPGAGPLIAAGPIIIGLRAAAVSGIANALIGLGISGSQANHFETKIKRGCILITVQTDNWEGATSASEIFMETGGQDICMAGESSNKESATEYASRHPQAASSSTRPQMPEQTLRPHQSGLQGSRYSCVRAST